MWISKVAKLCEKVFYPASKMFSYIGAVIIIVLMFFIFSDTMLRYGFNRPVPGDYELIQFAQAIIISTALAYTMVQGRHVVVRFLSFPERVQASGELITYFIALVIFVLISWQSGVYGTQLWQNGTNSGVLRLPVAPFVYILAFGSALLSLTLLVKVLYFITVVFKR